MENEKSGASCLKSQTEAPLYGQKNGFWVWTSTVQRTWKFRLKKPANPHETRKKRDDIYFVVPSWSGRGESNPRIQLGKLMFCH